MSLNGHYEPNAPGATTLRDARPLWIDHQHVTAEVHDGVITVFVGLKIAYDGALPEFITSGSLVNAFAAEMAYAWARPDDDDEMAEPDVIPAAPLAPQFVPVGDPWDALMNDAATDALIARGAETDATVERHGTANPVTLEPREVCVGWDGASNPILRSVDPCGCQWTLTRTARLRMCAACLSAAVRRNV